MSSLPHNASSDVDSRSLSQSKAPSPHLDAPQPTHQETAPLQETHPDPKPPPPTRRAQLEEVEHDGRPAFVLTFTEVKLLGIAGVGFFLDAYDLFIINPVATMLQYRLYNGDHLPSNLEGFVKAGANIGSVVGQFAFGYAADALGRKKVYGKELMLIIFATIMTLTTPTGSLSPDGALVYLGVWRIVLGIGVGGDYPMSASITSDRANIRKRGTMLSYIFSMQGWGSFVGSLATIIVLAIYRHTIETEGKLSKVDGVWRIVIGISLIPAFATLYQRLTLPESTRYEASQKLDLEHRGEGEGEDEIEKLKAMQKKAEESPSAESNSDEKVNGSVEKVVNGSVEKVVNGSVEKVVNGSMASTEKVEGTETTSSSRGSVEADGPDLEVAQKKAHFKEFYYHFKKWKNGKMLLGTAMSWFLLDIAFYGINLNQNVVLQQIGFDGATGTPWHKMFKVSTGNMIITALGFVPGYYATVLTIEILGRKFIQIMGFLMAALFLAILAGLFDTLSKVQFIVCFAFLQFFFNFGANSTTYCYPAEVFPTRYRAFAHGISAASGKAGAIISALAFNTLSKKIGTPACLWIFFGCCIAGAGFTLLLPEVKGRDPDVILAQEIAEERMKRRSVEGRRD